MKKVVKEAQVKFERGEQTNLVLSLESVRGWYYMKSWGMTVLLKDWLDYVDFEPMLYKNKSNANEEISFFCDIYYPILPLGRKDVYSNYLIRLYLSDYQRTIDIPVTIIKKTWRAGFPRAGVMTLRYTDFPWRVLKPIKDYIDQPSDIDTLKKNLYIDHIEEVSVVIDIYNKNIVPWINHRLSHSFKPSDRQTWLLGLEKLYEMAVEVGKKEMLSAFSIPKSGYPYTGVFVEKNTYEHMSDKENDNPFNTYLQYCIKHQRRILNKS